MADAVRVPQFNIQVVKTPLPSVKVLQFNIQVVKPYPEGGTGGKANMFLAM